MSFADLSTWLKSELLADWQSPTASPPRPTQREARSPAPVQRTIFVAMPFATDYEDTFFVGIAPAAEHVGATALRVDHEQFAGDVVREIKARIGESHAVIADLSGARPNVLFETGYAQALKKPVVQITGSPLADLPFDVRKENTIAYSRGRTRKLQGELKPRLAALLGE